MITVEFMQNEWCVIFRPYEGADDSDSMLMATHREEAFAMQYAKNMRVVLAMYDRTKRT